MKKYNKKTLARVLCLFFVLSAFGGGLISSEKLLGGGQTYAIDLPDNVIEGGIVEGGLVTDENQGTDTESEATDDSSAVPDDGKDSEGENPAEDEAVEDSTSNKPARMQAFADEAGTGDFVVTGGEVGTDYEFSGTTLLITSGTPLVIKNKADGFTSHNIEIKEGVTANITLAGVRIHMNTTRSKDTSPVNMLGAGTTCNLTLQSGSVNTLNATKLFAAALHCSEGSTLTIDGSGTLNAYGGHGSAGIGSSFTETAGTMIFNNGVINAHAWRYDTSDGAAPADSVPAGFGPNNWDRADHIYSGGAGIGAGTYGGSTSIIINGGEIHAYGSAHGAGIGASYAHATAGRVQKGAVTTNSKVNLCGDITINGGYITSKGYSHGGAFGGSCGTTASGCTIRVNGGTLLPTAMYGNADFNGNGTGTVYITGGSVRTAGGSKFVNGNQTGVAYDKSKGTVFMVTIDLSGEADEHPEIMNGEISDWAVTIAGEEYDYGAPARFDQGKLYLWVPESAKGKNVSVSCKYGPNKTQLDPLYIEGANGNGTSILKRYIDFELPETYTNDLTKDYDGVAFDSYDLTENPITTPDGKVLNNNDAVEIIVQRYDKIGGTPLEPEHSTGGGNKMPTDAGIYRFTMISKQYANDPVFGQSYWGHRASGWAVINKIPSKVNSQYAVQIKQDPATGKVYISAIQVADTVQPGDNKSPHYAPPDGKVQFYINGVKVGPEIDLKDIPADGKVLTILDDYDIGGDGNIRVPELDSGEFKVTAVYSGGTNYLDGEAEATLVPWNIIDPKPGETPDPIPSIKDIVDTFPFINPPVPTVVKDKNPSLDDTKPVEGSQLQVVDYERIDPNPTNPEPGIDLNNPETWPMHGFFTDRINQKVSKGEKVSIEQLTDLINNRYVFTTKKGVPLFVTENGEKVPVKAKKEDIKILDKDGNDITEKVTKDGGIDLSEPGKYTVSVTVTDASGNKSTIDIAYNIAKPMILDPDINKDTNDDGIPDINIDTDDDGFPDINIDTDGDDKPDINIDTDGDGKPDVDIDTDGDGKPDINKDTDGDGKPDVDIDTNGDGKPDVNVDTNGDGKPDINKDTDGDGKPDVDIDTDGDGKPDINKDTDGDGKPDVDIDTNGDGKPDVNVDTNGDGKPDINKDTDGDGKPDVDIDTDGDGKPDINKDTDGDGKPDLDIDTNGDGKPDVNVDTNGDGKPDINIDTDGDGIPDLNVDTDGDGKPDTNIDTDGDGKPDKNIKDPSEIKDILNENEPADTDELPWWIPKTGDTANMLTWLVVLGAAVLGLCGTVYGIRKKKS